MVAQFMKFSRNNSLDTRTSAKKALFSVQFIAKGVINPVGMEKVSLGDVGPHFNGMK